MGKNNFIPGIHNTRVKGFVGIAVLAVLTGAVAITVFMAQRSQIIEQFAKGSNGGCTANGCEWHDSHGWQYEDRNGRHWEFRNGRWHCTSNCSNNNRSGKPVDSNTPGSGQVTAHEHGG